MRTTKPLFGIELLFDLSPDMLCLLGSDGYFIRVNQELCKALDYNQEVLLSSHILTFIHPDDKEDTIRQVEALTRNEASRLFKNRYQCADGSYKWLSWNASQLPDGTFFATARDVTRHKKVQDQLEKVARENQKIFDHSLDVLCQLDATGRFVRVSKAVQVILGYQENEMVGKQALEFIHHSDHKETMLVYKEVRTGCNRTNVENRYRHKNGAYVPMVWSATWLEKEQLILAVGRDASEREEQKQQIHFKERRLKSLIESGNDIIILLDANGIYKFVSASVKNILNTEPEFYIGKVTFDFIHQEDLIWVVDEFKAVLETTQPVYISPFRFQIETGEWVWLETIATNRLDDPAIEGIIINARDVTGKRKEEQEKLWVNQQLRLSNERYSLVTEATKDLIWDWDLETNSLSLSRGLEKYPGFNKDFGMFNISSWEDNLHDEDKEQVLTSIGKALTNREEKYWSEEYRYLKVDGSIMFICNQGYIIRNEDGKAVRMVGAMHDITELKAKEQRILKQNEQLREIAQINSHELRKPVASILGLMDIFDKSSVQNQENREILTLLEGTVQELDEIIRRINNKATDGT